MDKIRQLTALGFIFDHARVECVDSYVVRADYATIATMNVGILKDIVHARQTIFGTYHDCVAFYNTFNRSFYVHSKSGEPSAWRKVSLSKVVHATHLPILSKIMTATTPFFINEYVTIIFASHICWVFRDDQLTTHVIVQPDNEARWPASLDVIPYKYIAYVKYQQTSRVCFAEYPDQPRLVIDCPKDSILMQSFSREEEVFSSLSYNMKYKEVLLSATQLINIEKKQYDSRTWRLNVNIATLYLFNDNYYKVKQGQLVLIPLQDWTRVR